MARKPRGSGQTASAPLPPPWRVPPAWEWTTVGRVGSVRLGRQRSPETESAAYPTPYLRAANIKQIGLDLTEVLQMDFDPVERQVYALKAGDVVLAEASGSAAQVGRAAIWSDEIPECCFQNTVVRFRPHAVTPAYALLVFQHFAQSGAFAAVARGVGIQHLGASYFVQMPFPLPPLAEQVRIAAEANAQLLNSSEARGSIESALRRIADQDNTILEAAALGGLVESGPPESFAPLPRGGPEQNAERTLFPDTEPLPSEDFADLMTRALPPAWRWIRVDQAGELRLGRQRSPEHEYGEHLHPYLRVANVFEDRIDTSDVRLMNFTPQEQKLYHLTLGDILLNEGQSPELVGRPAMYRGQPEKAYFQNTLIRFRAAEFVDADFALLVFRHYLRSGQFTRAARWSTNIAHLGVSRLASMPFPLPPKEEQARIVAEARTRLGASVAQRASTESSLTHLRYMREKIIRDAVSGDLVTPSMKDETAKALLARLGPPVEPTIQTEGKERRMKRRVGSREEPAKSLYETIVKLDGPVPPPRLFEAAGYNRDSVADVETFYLALREELGKRIQENTSEAGSRLEGVVDASR